MKILAVTTLFPNAATPNHGVFVENRLCAFRDQEKADIRVIAPVPWFPLSARVFGRYADFARAPRAEIRRGLTVSHPRYLIAPKVSMTQAVCALADCIVAEARRLIDAGWDFDLIDAHYLFPDGVAAMRAAKTLGKPFVLTARGSDVTQIPDFAGPRAMILDAVRTSAGVIAVADALKQGLVDIGAPADKITVLRNGVDLDRFRPIDRASLRKRMNLTGTVLVSVGSLIERKGHDIAIGAMTELTDATLLVVGDGPLRATLARLAKSLGVADRVRFVGAVPHDGLVDYYNAADALILASTREGWPNVLLEAMACGAPVIASTAGGNREIVTAPCAGAIVDERTPQAFAAAARRLLAAPDRAAVRAHAEAFSWRQTAVGMARVFENAVKDAATEKALRLTPLRCKGANKPKLLITVDTEEEFDWAQMNGADHAVSHPDDINRFQTLCEKSGAHPLYFLTFPLLADTRSRDYFRRLDARGVADFGIHPHAWNTPPERGFDHDFYSWQSNLPADVHRAKLNAMTTAFDDCFGRAPLAHRAGRYGVNRRAYADLIKAGLLYDFSPSPAFDFSAGGGPDFSACGNNPFTVESADGRIAVTPVSGAFALRGAHFFVSQRRRRRRWRRAFAPMRLTCEQARLRELVSLTRRLAADGAPVITFSLHSTSLTPGANPYARDAGAVDAMLDLTERYLRFFTEDYGGEIIGFSDLEALYAAAG